MIGPGPQLLAGEQTAGETTEQSEAMEVDEVLSTEEQVVAQFADGGPAAAYRGKWLCYEAAFEAKKGIVFLEKAIGKEVDKRVLKGWKGAAKGKMKDRMTKIKSVGGLLVNGVLIFKALDDECYGEKAKYIAFGERPPACVKVQMKELQKRENDAGSAGNEDPPPRPPLLLLLLLLPTLLVPPRALHAGRHGRLRVQEAEDGDERSPWRTSS